MRKYLLLIIISFSFCQNQKIFSIVLKNGDIVKVTEYRDTGRVIRINGDIIEGDSKRKSYGYNEIEKIVFNGYTHWTQEVAGKKFNKFNLKERNKNIKSKQYGYMGGVFIALGGILVVSSYDTEICTNCSNEELQDDIDNIETTQKIGFYLITLGGVLVALGI